MKIVSARQMAALDEETIERHGIPGLELMERAGTGIFHEVMATLERLGLPRRVVLFAGKGNNGGDAFVVARLLHGAGVEALTVLVGARPDELKGDASANYRRLTELDADIIEAAQPAGLEALRARCEAAGLVVDGLLGTGLSGEPAGLMADAIGFINSLGVPVVAVDIPSGISGDTGAANDCYVRADLTVTMALPKFGCFLARAINGLGRLSVVDIGIPDEVVARARSRGELLTPREVAPLLPERDRYSHKGTYGRLFVLAGSRGYTGAAAMTANAAMRAGAGLVFLGIPESLNPILETKCTEAITVPLPETPHGTTSDEAYFEISRRLADCDALAIGPGLSTNPHTAALVRRLLSETALPVVLDADGLNCLAGRADVLRACRGPVIITPHPGELARLTGMGQARIVADPWGTARQTAHTHRVTVVLKGAHTCIAAPGIEQAEAGPHVNIMGNAGMASGGVGDVLTGMLGALLAQGLAPLPAARLSVLVHAAAGDVAVAGGDPVSLVATDLIQALPKTFRWLRRKKQPEPSPQAVARCYYDEANRL
jgi:hydroxyethylthiazole kinase-like uncharacterized protein yjeF